MAKKKKKKSKSSISELLLAVTAMLAIVSFIMMFMTKLELTLKSTSLVSTIEWKNIFFGKTRTSGSTSFTTINGVIMGFIAYIVILLGGLGAVFTVFMKNKTLSGFLAFLCGLVMIGFGICIFFIPSMFADKNEAIKTAYDIKLTIAPILGGVFAILGGVLSVASPVLKKVL